MLGYKPSTQHVVAVDALKDTQVQNTQTDDDVLTEIGSTSNLNTSDTTVCNHHSGTEESISGTDKLSRRKRQKLKFDMTGEILMGMQEKSDKDDGA